MNSVNDYKTKSFQEALKKSFNTDNPMAIPKISKIVINVGVGEAVENQELIDLIKQELMKITGQIPQISKSKKSISAFKLKAGVPIGCKVTLRKNKMLDFLFKLIHAILPRIRDFRGISPKSFDKKGNLNIGIPEYLLFPEIKFDEVKKNFGLGINIYTTTNDSRQAQKLLENYGLIFQKGEKE